MSVVSVVIRIFGIAILTREAINGFTDIFIFILVQCVSPTACADQYQYTDSNRRNKPFKSSFHLFLFLSNNFLHAQPNAPTWQNRSAFLSMVC